MTHARSPQLRYAILELSLRCNLRCVHCASGSGRPRPAELDLAAWREVVADLAELECPSVDLMGGEALMSPLLEPVGRELQRLGLGWGLLTNGWALTSERARELLQAGCRGIGVSLDGADAATHDGIRGVAGAFDRALRAIEVVGALDLKPTNRSVLTSVNSRNLGELDALAELLAARAPGVRWQLNLCSAASPRLPADMRLDREGVRQVERFLRRVRTEARYGLRITGAHDLGYFVNPEQLNDHDWQGCPAGIHNVGVQSDGVVKGCLALDESFGVGNVTERRLVELWRDESTMRRYRECSRDDLGPECRQCQRAEQCRGGCTAYSVAKTGLAHNHPDCLHREQRRHLPVVSAPPLTPAPPQRRPWKRRLRSACIELTRRCNLRCQHCGSASGEERRAELSLEQFVDIFADLHRLGCERVVLLGGEPLMHPDWPEIAEMARLFDLRVAFVTNGTRVTQTSAERLAALSSHVGVSLDGATDAVHDSLRGVKGARVRAWQAIDLLQQAGAVVTVVTTLCQENLSELEALRDQLRGRGLVWQIQAANSAGERFDESLLLAARDILGVARFIADTRRRFPRCELAVAGAHSIGHHAESIADWGTVGQWQGCPGGVESVGICADGSIKGCLSMGPESIVGSLQERRLYDLWQDRQTFAVERGFRSARLQGGCADCEHGETCRAGCPEMARAATGDRWDNPLCARRAEAAPAA